MAKPNPSGTRTRRAMADQLAMALPQQLTRRSHDLTEADFQQPVIGRGTMSVAGGAGWRAQHDIASAKRSIALGIRGSEDPHYWNAQGGRQMHGTGVTSDEQVCPPC